jgi:hypothetical protein
VVQLNDTYLVAMLMCGFTSVLNLNERGLATLLRSANSKKISEAKVARI